MTVAFAFDGGDHHGSRASQLPNAERIARADAVVDNNDMPDAMLAQLRRHWQRIGA